MWIYEFRPCEFCGGSGTPEAEGAYHGRTADGGWWFGYSPGLEGGAKEGQQPAGGHRPYPGTQGHGTGYACADGRRCVGVQRLKAFEGTGVEKQDVEAGNHEERDLPAEGQVEEVLIRRR